MKFEFVSETEKVRLDMFLIKKLENVSRSKIKKEIDNKNILVNGNSVKSGFELRNGDVIKGEIAEEIELNSKPENIDIDIVFEDNDLLVINKQAGLVVHPSITTKSGTLVNALTFHVKNLSSVNGEFRPGIVHRLDKDTTGLLLVAKNDETHRELARQIETKECKRFYKGLVYGRLKESEGVVKNFLTRSEKDRKKYVVSLNKGKFSETHYKTLETFKGYSLLEFELKTGRTHQIRVHAKHLGHPIVGDKLYGFHVDGENLKSQLLHAYKITFFHPNKKEWLTFEAPLPLEFDEFIKKVA